MCIRDSVMPDGKTIIVTDGVITEIKDPDELEEDEVKACLLYTSRCV